MKNRKNLIKLIEAILFFVLISPASSTIVKSFGITKLSTLGNVIYQFILSIIITSFVCILYFDRLKSDFISFKKNIKSNIKTIIKYFFIFMVLKFTVSFISALIYVLLGFDPTSFSSVNQQIIESFIKAYPIIMVIDAAILAPFYEESIFRLAFKSVFKNKWLFIIISGSIFGLIHVFPLSDGVTLGMGIIQSISYVFMGIFLGYIYEKTDNIYINMFVHLLNNLISILAIINFY